METQDFWFYPTDQLEQAYNKGFGDGAHGAGYFKQDDYSPLALVFHLGQANGDNYPDNKGWYWCLVMNEEDRTFKVIKCYYNGSDFWNGDLPSHAEVLAWTSLMPKTEETEPKLCLHPRNERSYIGEGYLRCSQCGEVFK